MKTLLKLFSLLILVAVVSCDELINTFPKSSFDAPYPKGNKDLRNILGNQITIKKGEDTLNYKVSYNLNKNLITNIKTGDTIFLGTVSKYRGLYYFSHQLNDSSYWIYAVKITDNLIYGINSAWHQLLFVDKAIKNGHHKTLIKYINHDTSIIRLHPEKSELKKLFTSIINSIQPDTILNYKETVLALKDKTNALTEMDPEDFNFLLKIYPNPVTDIVNIELQQKDNLTYTLKDVLGNIILQGHLTKISNKIDLSKLQNGMYFLSVINEGDLQKDLIKIIKTE